MKRTAMLTVAAIGALAIALGASPLQAEVAGPATHGAYTAGQAAAGAKTYTASCSACHGVTLRGGLGPALIGDAFTAQWTGEPAEDMYSMMSTNMPQGAPASLKPGEYLAIMAYILQQNKFPAGSTPLTEAKLKAIKIVAPPN